MRPGAYAATCCLSGVCLIQWILRSTCRWSENKRLRISLPLVQPARSGVCKRASTAGMARIHHSGIVQQSHGANLATFELCQDGECIMD